MQRHQLTASICVLMLMVSFAFAEIPFNINYQARLSDHDTGEPVPDNIYPAEFRFYADSTSGSPELTRTMNVNTQNGFFNAVIGGTEPLYLNAFGDRVFMEVVINGEVMLPRAPLAVVPYSGISQRVLGDIQTGAGLLKMIDPVDDGLGLEILTNDNTNSIKLIDPVDDGVPVAILMADATQSALKLIDPVDDGLGFELLVNAGNHSFKMIDPVDDGKSLMEMSGGIAGEASIKMFNPQPEPPAQIVAINSSPTTGGSIKMFNPQPEPPAEPLLEMNTTELGASFEMTAPQVGGVASDITDPMLQIYTSADGAGINLSDEIGRYMGFEPMPFSPGGVLYFIDPSADDTTAYISSDGSLTARKATIGWATSNNGINNLTVGAYHTVTGSWSFAGGYLAQIYHNECFVWSDYTPDVPLTTTANNQFLVRASGGTKFYSDGVMNYGVELTPGAYSWSSIVPASSMRDIHEADGQQILDRIERLPINSYRMNSEDQSIEHIGPMAEDFNNLFHTGNDEDHLSAMDQSGVALAGVQALIKTVNELKEENKLLRAEIEQLKDNN